MQPAESEIITAIVYLMQVVLIGTNLGLYGATDVAASSWRKGNRFDWFEQRAGQWLRHPIEENIGETRTICASDIDGDGKIDLPGTARTGNQVSVL